MPKVAENLMLCPECGTEMHKAGKVWSGRHRKQRYSCPACGRKTTTE